MASDAVAPVVDLSVEGLMAEACAQSALSDFGDLWFTVPLERLVHFATVEGGLTAEDPRAGMLVRNLVDRLRLIDTLRKHPEIAQERLDVAGVIIGQARGGSTLMQRLLGRSPQLTSPYFWEMMMPLPLPGERTGDPSPRIQAAHGIVDHMLSTWPEMRSWHPIEAEAHEEEIHMLDRSFMSSMYSGYFFMPGYSRWLVRQDHRRAYEEMILWLKLLQWQMPERRSRKWLLKSPNHFLAGSLPAVLALFPEARIIMTHRRMEDLIPSVCSIAANSLAGNGGPVDRKRFGAVYMQTYRDALDVMERVRAETPAERFFDMRYTEIMADTPGAFRDAMGAMGLSVGPEDEAAMAEWLARNGRDSHPRHRYSAEEFGLTREAIAAAFADYHRKYL